MVARKLANKHLSLWRQVWFQIGNNLQGFHGKTTGSAHVLQTLLSECLTRLFDIGLCVKSVIFDQGASNQKLVKLLDVTVEMPFFVMITIKCLLYSTLLTY